MAWSLLDRFVRFQPVGDVEYPQALRMDDPGFSRLRQVALGVGGAMLGLLLLFSIPGLVAQAVLWVSFWISGSPGSWTEYASAASTFGIPAGMVAAHLGLGSMTLVSLGLVVFVNRSHPRWLPSVQPGFRWRFAAVAALAALVVLGGIWAVSSLGRPWVWNPESQLGWYLVAIVVTAPLQAAGEEFIFRGYLMQSIALSAVDPRRSSAGGADSGTPSGRLAAQFPNWVGIIGSAVIFALLHPAQDLPAFLYPLGFGVLAGWLAMKTGGLEAGIAAHVVNNIITFGYAAVSGTMVQTFTQRALGWVELVIALASFGIFAAVAVWLARRMHLATRTPQPQFGR